jgi:hypothetical protein
MGVTFPWHMEFFLLIGYVMFSIFLNMLALLISSFYQKKFNQPSPKSGFFSSIALAIVFITLMFIPQKASIPLQILSTASLIGSSVTSIYSVLYLFFTMRKVRK